MVSFPFQLEKILDTIMSPLYTQPHSKGIEVFGEIMRFRAQTVL